MAARKRYGNFPYLLTNKDIEVLESYDYGGTSDCGAMLEYIGKFIAKGMSEGRFTERQAHRNLEIALWVGYACNNMGDYEHYYTAVEWLSRVEDLARGCGTWYYRYANALMYCGKPALALEYCERGVQAEPDYPWCWLTLGRLRAHFGDRRGAIKAADRGLELVPGDREFLTLLDDIDNDRTLEEMEFHFIGPDEDDVLRSAPESDPEAYGKRLAIEGIVCDRENLDRLKRQLGITGWSPDHPYCTFLMDYDKGSVMVTFMMNEAAFSKQDPDRMAEILDSLGFLDSEARAHLAEKSGERPMTLFALNVGRTLDVTLSYSVAGSEDVLTVTFNDELDLVEARDGGPFAAIVLLSDPSFDLRAMVADLRDEWGVVLEDQQLTDDSLMAKVGDDMVAVSIVRSPVPGNEASDSASNNYLWPDAQAVSSMHRAHLIVALVNRSGDPLQCGLLFTKIIASCCRQPQVLGVYHCNTVFEPGFFIENAAPMKSGDLPLSDMVWFGIYRSEGRVNAYTVGMTAYAKDEMEIIGADDDPYRVMCFLYDVAYHVLDHSTVLRDGDTIGFEPSQSLRVSRGPGVSVSGTTLKIEYPKQ